MNNSYKFTKSLASDLLDSVSDSFLARNPKFSSFLTLLVDESSEIKVHKSSEERTNSKGHSYIYGMYKQLFPNNRINQNCTIKIEINGQRKNIEFDIVNHTQKIIIEIDGSHHRKYIPHFHKKGIQDFLNQVNRDSSKDNWAKENGWTMIRIRDDEALKISNHKELQILINKFISESTNG